MTRTRTKGRALLLCVRAPRARPRDMTSRAKTKGRALLLLCVSPKARLVGLELYFSVCASPKARGITSRAKTKGRALLLCVRVPRLGV